MGNRLACFILFLIFSPPVSVSLFAENSACRKHFEAVAASHEKRINIKAQAGPSPGPGYFIMTRNFGDKTLESIIDVLPALKTMGVKWLWISPNEPQTHDSLVNTETGQITPNVHGYWPDRHGVVDNKLGGAGLYRILISEAEKHGIEILQDIVTHQFGYGDSFLINGTKVGISDERIFKNGSVDYNQVPEGLDAALENETGLNQIRKLLKEYTRYKLAALPAFDHTKPRVQNYLIDRYRKYIDLGTRNFRIDAAKHMPLSFVAKFINKLAAYSPEKLTFLLEVLFFKYPPLDVYAGDLLAEIKNPAKTDLFFLDFPLAGEIRRIHGESNYRFDWLKKFIDYRENGQHYLANLVPMTEDHDFLTPFQNGVFPRKIVHVIADFFSGNPQILLQGTEQTGKIMNERQYVGGTVNPSGDISQIVSTMTDIMEPYRKSKTFFKTDWLLAENNVLLAVKKNSKNSLFLFINKGNEPFEIAIPGFLKYHMGRKIEHRLSDSPLSVNTKITGTGKLLIKAAPHSYSVFEIKNP